MIRIGCHVRPDCEGFDFELEGEITVETFELMNQAKDAHYQAHRAEITETHIRKQINPRRIKGNGFYTLKLSAAENGSQTLCGAPATTEDMTYGDTRHASSLAYVSCETCKNLRTRKA